jgi:hypothetical protein
MAPVLILLATGDFIVYIAKQDKSVYKWFYRLLSTRGMYLDVAGRLFKLDENKEEEHGHGPS